jgi:hypothetical protein
MVKKAGSLLSKVANVLREAHDAHKDDETVLGGGGSLPNGIENGVAQLVDIYFKEYEKGDMKGEIFFYAAGIVKAPSHQDGIPIVGLRTSIMEPLCDTPGRSRKTVEDHWAWILNELRKLGLDTSEIEFDTVEDAVAALKEAGPHFRFRTWQGEPTAEYPNPRVNEQWRGVCDFEAEFDDGVEDATEEVEEEAKPAPKASKTAPSATKPAPKASTPPAAASAAKKGLGKKAIDYASMDTDALAKLADNEDEKAQERLTELAQEAGIDPTDAAYENWTMVAEALNNAGDESEDPAALAELADGGDSDAVDKLQALADAANIDTTSYESWSAVAEALSSGEATEEYQDAEEFAPSVKEIYFYKPPKAKKAVECEVTAVFASKETANLKDLDKGTSYKSVPWAELKSEA